MIFLYGKIPRSFVAWNDTMGFRIGFEVAFSFMVHLLIENLELHDKIFHFISITPQGKGELPMCKGTRYCMLRKSIVVIFIPLFLVAGCAPVISKQIREQVKPTITPEAVLSDPNSYKGEMIILSGIIIESENSNEGTLLKVLQRPAGFRGKPKDIDESSGRYLALVDHYLDTAIYTKGRAVTTAGEVQGTRELPLGETKYTYPVISVKEIYLWPVERDTYAPYPSFHIGFGFGYFY